MREEDGWVGVTRHQSKYIFQPLVEELIHYRGSGTSCVLTQTNEEAVILVALLRKYGINSKLVQSMDGFLFLEYGGDEVFLEVSGQTSEDTSNSRGIMERRQTCNLFRRVPPVRSFDSHGNGT